MFAIGDVLFITSFYTVLTLLLRRFRRPSSLFALPAVFVVSWMAWLLGLLLYSPASILGGSSYHHRVLVEGGPWPDWSLILPAFMADGSVWLSVAIAGLLILGLIRVRERIPAIVAVSAFRVLDRTRRRFLRSAGAPDISCASPLQYRPSECAEDGRCCRDQFPALQPLIFSDQALSPGTPTESVDSAGRGIEWNLLSNGRLQPATVEAVRQLLRSRSGNQFLSIYFQTSSRAFARASDHPAYKSPYMDIRYLRG